jgi:hypothetical protein
MAQLRRPLALGGLPLLIGAGCGDPISNALFLEEAEFLAALPGQERLATPESIFLAPNGDAALLRAAKEAATEWEGLVAVLAVSGDGLRAQAEDAERTDVVRRWHDVNVAHRFSPANPLGFAPTSTDWFVDGEILRLGETTFAWSLALSTTAEQESITVASGVHDAAGGTFTWDGAAAASALGVVPPAEVGAFDMVYTLALAETAVPTLDATQDLEGGPGRSFTIVGSDLIAFDAVSLALTVDGLAWPGAAVVVHRDGGGRADGFVLQEGIARSFGSCWDDLGATSWVGGDPEILASGAESSCALEPIVP